MDKDPYKNKVKKKLKKTIAEVEKLDKKVTSVLDNPKAKAAMLCEPAVDKSKEDMEQQLEALHYDQKNLQKGKISPKAADDGMEIKKKKIENALDRIKSQFPEEE